MPLSGAQQRGRPSGERARGHDHGGSAALLPAVAARAVLHARPRQPGRCCLAPGAEGVPGHPVALLTPCVPGGG